MSKKDIVDGQFALDANQITMIQESLMKSRRIYATTREQFEDVHKDTWESRLEIIDDTIGIFVRLKEMADSGQKMSSSIIWS